MKHLGTFTINGAQPASILPADIAGHLVSKRPTLVVRTFNNGPEVVSLVTAPTAAELPTANDGLSTMTIAPGATETFEVSAVHHVVGFNAVIPGAAPGPDLNLRVDLFLRDDS